jgi:hypothetical protein
MSSPFFGILEGNFGKVRKTHRGDAVSERITQITIVKKSVHQLLPGEATFEQATGAWYVGCPAGHRGAGNLGGHDVRFDEATGMLTVSPSILCGCGAHYFIEENRVRWV